MVCCQSSLFCLLWFGSRITLFWPECVQETCIISATHIMFFHYYLCTSVYRWWYTFSSIFAPTLNCNKYLGCSCFMIIFFATSGTRVSFLGGSRSKRALSCNLVPFYQVFNIFNYTSKVVQSNRRKMVSPWWPRLFILLYICVWIYSFMKSRDR